MIESLKAKLEKKIEILEEDMKWGMGHGMSSGMFDRLSTTKSCYQTFLSMLENEPDAKPDQSKEFKELVMSYSNGRPYFSIVYFENGEEFEGYSSYSLEVISDFLKEFFGFAQPAGGTAASEADIVECPTCHHKFYWVASKISKLNFCPNCGVDMKGEHLEGKEA